MAEFIRQCMTSLIAVVVVYFIVSGIFTFAYIWGYNKRRGELEAEKESTNQPNS